MPLAQLAARLVERPAAKVEREVAAKAMTPAQREAARTALTRGGSMAQDVLGIGVGGAKVTSAAKAAAKAAKKDVLPAQQRVVANHVAGHQREKFVEKLLKAIFPKEENFSVFREQYLRTRKGVIAIDKRTQESRRIDFVVFKGKELVRSLEVTSETVDKAQQLRKEMDIRKAGGNFLLHPETGRMVRIPAKLKTKVIRLA